MTNPLKSVLAGILALVSLASASSAPAALALGAAAPRFSAPGAQGGAVTTIELANLIARGPVVIYFFPSAFTDSAQSREFAAAFDQFRAAGVNVVGMSRDSVETLARYSVEECAGKFPVASASESLVNAFDVNDGAMFNTRTTYVIDATGKIVFVHDDPEHSGHVTKALAFVQAMRK